MAWLHAGGMDFAQKHDWSAAVVLACEPEPPARGVWMPWIAGLRKLKADMGRGVPSASMLDIVEGMCVGLLDHFPLSRLLGDSTHDEGSCDWLARRYGRGVVEGMSFGGRGQMSLWHDTLHYVAAPQGFGWPDLDALGRGTRAAADVSELQQQISAEQAILNGRGQYSFYHPGEHNDFLHAFNLACVAMRQVQLAVASVSTVMVAPASGPSRFGRMSPLMATAWDGGHTRSRGWGTPRMGRRW